MRSSTTAYPCAIITGMACFCLRIAQWPLQQMSGPGCRHGVPHKVSFHVPATKIWRSTLFPAVNRPPKVECNTSAGPFLSFLSTFFTGGGSLSSDRRQKLQFYNCASLYFALPWASVAGVVKGGGLRARHPLRLVKHTRPRYQSLDGERIKRKKSRNLYTTNILDGSLLLIFNRDIPSPGILFYPPAPLSPLSLFPARDLRTNTGHPDEHDGQQWRCQA